MKSISNLIATLKQLESNHERHNLSIEDIKRINLAIADLENLKLGDEVLDMTDKAIKIGKIVEFLLRIFKDSS